MKKLLLFSLLFTASQINAQIVVNAADAVIPCCNHEDSIDYNLDGSYDMTIYSQQIIDNSSFWITGDTTFRFTGVTDFGQPFDFQYSGNPKNLQGTTIGCSGWYSYWPPGTGQEKYIGFYEVVNATDTIYGWVRGMFDGIVNSTCDDTMKFYQVAYNTVPNEPLIAGQVVGLDEISMSNFCVYPNPAKEELYISLGEIAIADRITITDLQGKKLLSVDHYKAGQPIPIHDLSKGVYLVELTNGEQSEVLRLAIE